jgi:phytoene dehydrogenase-like protein
VAPEGHSNLFLLVPIAAGLDDRPALRAAYRDKILGDLREHTGTDLDGRIVFEREFCVSDFERRYHSTQGTALGLAHTVRQTSLLRPPHRSRKLRGLYYSGAYTTPGIGVPMALISGEITAQYVSQDFGN